MVMQRTFLARSRMTHERSGAWEDTQLRDVASGAQSTALGVKPCYCQRNWPCAVCHESFVCWNVWPFLWRALPAELHRTTLCRRCYGEKLLESLGSKNGRVEVPDAVALPRMVPAEPAVFMPVFTAPVEPPKPMPPRPRVFFRRR